MNMPIWQQRFLLPAPYRVFLAARRPERSLLVWNPEGTYQLYAWDRGNNKRHPLTDVESGQLFGAISSDGTEIYALVTEDGSERGHVHVMPWEGGEATDISPELPPYTCFEIAVAHERTIIGFSASFDTENTLVVVDRNQSSPRLLYTSSQQMSDPVFSEDGTLVAVTCSLQQKDGEWEVLLLSSEDGKVLYRAAISGGHSHPIAIDGRGEDARLLVTTNVRGYEEPAWITRGQEPQFMQDHPTCDHYVLAYEHKSKQLLCCTVQNAKHSLTLVPEKLPRELVCEDDGSYDLFFGGGHFLANDSILVRHQNSVTPPSLIVFEKKGGESITILSSPSLPCQPFESMTFRTPDGASMQAWVAFPKNAEHPLPFVIDVHGGPNGLALNGFSPEAQAWLDHGVGYCAVNYRGSISFGKEFEQAIRGKPGTYEVIDCVAAKEELVKRGWAQSNAIILSGWSWGGYITLLALGKEPQQWAAGIAAVPIADWIEQYQNEPSYLQAFDQELFGGSPAEVPERYSEASPITYIEQLKAPILIIAGEHDSRCPMKQIETYVSRAESCMKDVRLHLLNAGHTGAFGNAKIGIDAFNAVKKFLHEKKYPTNK